MSIYVSIIKTLGKPLTSIELAIEEAKIKHKPVKTTQVMASMLHRQVKTGKLIRLERGLYTIPSSSIPE